MADLGLIISKANSALGILKMLEPVLKDTPYVSDVLGIVGKILAGASTGKAAYEHLVDELDQLNVEMEAIRARGGVTGDDIRAEVSAIAERGARIDDLLARLQG